MEVYLLVYAVIKTGGKQYKIREGDFLRVEKLDAQVGDTVDFEEILLVNDGNGNMQIGNPVVANAKVSARVLEQGRGKKIVIYKYKRRKKYRRKQGHRQPFTRVQITKIEA